MADLNCHDEEGVRKLHEAGSDWAFYNGGNRWTYGVYLFKAAKQFGMKFRLNWHWNATAGDPYYALDCREDDYAWCNTNARRRADPLALLRAQMRGGLDDYRRLLTLSRLAAAESRRGRPSLDPPAHGRLPSRPARPRRDLPGVRLAGVPAEDGHGDRTVTVKPVTGHEARPLSLRERVGVRGSYPRRRRCKHALPGWLSSRQRCPAGRWVDTATLVRFVNR